MHILIKVDIILVILFIFLKVIIMDKQKLYSLTDNTWSKKYQYIFINKDSEKIITDIFGEPEDSEDDE